jgi:hypothetical protein
MVHRVEQWARTETDEVKPQRSFELKIDQHDTARQLQDCCCICILKKSKLFVHLLNFHAIDDEDRQSESSPWHKNVKQCVNAVPRAPTSFIAQRIGR